MRERTANGRGKRSLARAGITKARDEDKRWKRGPKERMDRSVVRNAGGRRAEQDARCHPLTLLRPPEATRCCELGAGKDWEGTFSILDPWPGPCPGSAAGQDRSVLPLQGNTSRSGSEAGQRPSPRPTSGVAEGEARHDAARRGRGGRSQRDERSAGGEEPDPSTRAALALHPEFQHRSEVTAIPC